MNQTLNLASKLRSLKHKSYKKASLLMISLIAVPLLLLASHFRYGNISWTNVTGNTVNFKISQAWRGDAFGSFPSVGNAVNTSETFYFGDGTFTTVVLTVTSVNPGENWFYGEMTVSHTYISAGNYTAYESSCCRIGGLQNNSGGSFTTQTTINVGSGNSSPVSSLVPIIDVPNNNPSATFTIPAVDPNGQPLTFRFSNSTEAGPGFSQPTGLTLNSSTGQLTFNTVGLNIGDLFTSQVMIGDGTVEIPIDFIIRISSIVGTAPVFNYPPTPPNGQLFTVAAGSTLNFTVQASDADAGDNVTLSVAGAPVGSTLTPNLPASGNPVSSAFSWTTSVANIGSYVVNFNAQDNTLQSANSSVTIQVVASVCNVSLSASTTNVSCNGGSNGAIDLTISGATGTPTISWSNGATTEDISGLPAGTYSVTVTDENGCIASGSYNVTEPNSLTSSSAATSNFNGYNVSCAGGNNGAALVTTAGGTTPYQFTVNSTTNSTGIFTDLTAGSYNYSVSDANGCTSTGSFTISEPAAVSCSITVTPEVTVANHAAHTIYLGYGPQSVTLTAQGSGGVAPYAYSWSTTESGASITVSPTTTTTYTVTTTDANGCSSSCSVIIYVVDVRCGKDLDKVLVCHMQGTPANKVLCIGVSGVADHLAHGDMLGECTSNNSARGAAPKTDNGSDEISKSKSVMISARPNPSKNSFVLTLSGYKASKISLKVTDANGRLIERRELSGSASQIEMGTNYKRGLYFATLIQDKHVKTLKLIKN